MDRNKIKERLELALRPAEPPTIEEVLEQVSTRGVLRGPVDWVFPAWMLYVEYATQKIAETFPLSEEEKRQLLHFRDTLTRLLREAWMQAKEKLAALYKAVVEGTYRVEGKRLYAPDGTWMYVGKTVMHIPIHGITAETYFPDVLKLQREKLKLFQLGWRASDESTHGRRPTMGTTQPWQLFAWTAVRYGKLYIRIGSVILTSKGITVRVNAVAKSWQQMWNKNEAISLVAEYIKRGEWTPLFTMWLGDGNARRGEFLLGKHRLIIAAKEPWKLGKQIAEREALIANGKDAFIKLKNSANVYGEFLELLKSHKWVIIKLVVDNNFKATYKQKLLKQTIGVITIANIEMRLQLVYCRAGTIRAHRRVRTLERALQIAETLKSVGANVNIVRSRGLDYEVYIPLTDLLQLAEKDESIKRAIGLFLVDKAKNGTPKQKEVARKILRRYPFFVSLRVYELPVSQTLPHSSGVSTSMKPLMGCFSSPFSMRYLSKMPYLPEYLVSFIFHLV